MPALLAGPAEHRLSWRFNVLINGIIHTPLPDTAG